MSFRAWRNSKTAQLGGGAPARAVAWLLYPAPGWGVRGVRKHRFPRGVLTGHTHKAGLFRARKSVVSAE